MFSIHMGGQDKTRQIVDWVIWEEDGKVLVKGIFPSGKDFIRPLDNCKITPKKEIEGKLLLKKGTYQVIQSATEYGNKFVVIQYPNSKKKYVMRSDKISITACSNIKNEDTFSYFKAIAKERMEQAKEKIIPESVVRQLEKITPCSGTALHAYCYKKNEARVSPKHLIFPFGLNESQLLAVENAFRSQISIIEGPPGTGKTQTILNIIANILINKKTVAIVSNNNLAVENVYEKMARKNLDYLVAELGNNKNKEAFFEKQKSIPSSEKSATHINIKEIDTTLDKVKKHLETQNAIAQLTAEIGELNIEKQYLEDWHEENNYVNLIDITRYNLEPKKVSELIAYMNYLSEKRISFKEKFRLLLSFKMVRTKFLKEYTERVAFIYSLQFYYYRKMIRQKQKQLDNYRAELKKDNFQNLLEHLTNQSMRFLKQRLAVTIPNSRTNFTLKNYKNKFEEFNQRFPIIGSSSYSIVNSLADGAVLDYIIVDEASQQDIVPGILSLGCARNIIVVGDRKQLSHIPQKSEINAPERYYDCTKYSLLDSFVGIFKEQAPITLLKEHYRCHPKIIQYCNQQFYNNQLVPMTTDKGEAAIELIITSKGNHTRKNTNLRELESLRELGFSIEGDKGFIAPYNNQVDLAGKYLPENFVSATVHKFQGRECKEITFSTVLDKKASSQKVIDFVDNPQLVNVAVSRAINKFTLVTGNEVFTKNNKSISALIRYMKYYATEGHIHDSPVISAFDLLYTEYDKSLEKLNARLNLNDSKYKSERIVARLLKDILKKDEFRSLKFHMQIKLIQLVSTENTTFTTREIEFMRQQASCDFVIYYRVGKEPIGVIEVDGGSHGESKQRERDELKNTILEKTQIPLQRLQTIEGNIETKIEEFLHNCISGNGKND